MATEAVSITIAQLASHLASTAVREGVVSIVSPKPPRKPIHLNGFQAFPSEIRERIFAFYHAQFEDVDVRSLANPLLTMLSSLKHRAIGKEWYEEALASLYSVATVALSGEYHLSKASRAEFPHCKPWIMKHSFRDVFINAMCYSDLELARNLKIFYEIAYVIPDHNPFHPVSPFRYDWGPHEIGHFDNIIDLTLQFEDEESLEKGGEEGFDLGHLLIQRVLVGFKKLRKLSVSFPWVDWQPWYRKMGWRAIQHTELSYRFEEITLDIIVAALGVYPKLRDVRPSQLCAFFDWEGKDLDSFYFQEYAHGIPAMNDNDRDKIMWFWQVEPGQTLVWNEERADKMRREKLEEHLPELSA